MISAIPHCNGQSYNYPYNTAFKRSMSEMVKIDSTLTSSTPDESELLLGHSNGVIAEGDCVYPSSAAIDHHFIGELSPSKASVNDYHSSYSSSYIQSMQAAAYSLNTQNGPYVQTASGFYNNAANTYGMFSQSYGGPRSISQPYKAGTATALAAQAAYALSPYSFSSSSSPHSTQNPYYCGFGNSSATVNPSSAQSFASCQQALDYPYTYSQATSSYASYYPPSQSYAGYVPNSTSSSSNNGSVSATYQLNSPLTSSNGSAHFHPVSEISLSPSKSISETGAVKKVTAKSGRGRGRRQPNPSPDIESSLERVYIWDLDETIIIYNSLLTNEFPLKYNKDITMGTSLGLRMEQLIYNLSDTYFFFNDLEDCDQVHVDDTTSDDNGQDLGSYNFQTDGFQETSRNNGICLPNSGSRNGIDWMRKLAFRYRRIKEIYNQYRNNVEEVCAQLKLDDDWNSLRENIDNYTDQWLLLSGHCLRIISQRQNCINVLVSSSQLVPALAKLLLYGLGPIFPIENIYSSIKVGKDNCFQRIRERFGPKCTYIVIGDGDDEESAAKNLGMPFWRIRHRTDLENLYSVFKDDYL